MGQRPYSRVKSQVLLDHAGPFETGDTLGLPAVTDLNVVNYLAGASRLCHSSSRSLVLDDVGGSLPRHHTVLDMKVETVLSNLGFGQLHSDCGIDLRICTRYCASRRRGSAARPSAYREREHHVTEGKQKKNKKASHRFRVVAQNDHLRN
jgi:hypothetical protein